MKIEYIRAKIVKHRRIPSVGYVVNDETVTSIINKYSKQAQNEYKT